MSYLKNNKKLCLYFEQPSNVNVSNSIILLTLKQNISLQSYSDEYYFNIYRCILLLLQISLNADYVLKRIIIQNQYLGKKEKQKLTLTLLWGSY